MIAKVMKDFVEGKTSGNVYTTLVNDSYSKKIEVDFIPQFVIVVNDLITSSFPQIAIYPTRLMSKGVLILSNQISSTNISWGENSVTIQTDIGKAYVTILG